MPLLAASKFSAGVSAFAYHKKRKHSSVKNWEILNPNKERKKLQFVFAPHY